MTGPDGLGLRPGALDLIAHDGRWQGALERLRAAPALRDAYADAKRRIIAAGTARKDDAAAKTAFIARASAEGGGAP